mgnify:CR=1 FL=1
MKTIYLVRHAKSSWEYHELPDMDRPLKGRGIRDAHLMVTAQQNLAKVPSARSYAMAELVKSGVEFHSLTQDQLAEWKAAGGYQRSEWDQFKVELAGSMDAFNRLEEAAGTMSRYYVHDA